MKTTKVLKAILIGVIAGATIFFIPFPFRFFFIFFLIVFVIRFFAWRGRGRGTWNRNFSGHQHFWNPSYTQRWQSMSDDERKAFIKKMEGELFATNSAAQ